MTPIFQLWSITTIVFAAAVIMSEWLTGSGTPGAFGRFALVSSASGCLLLVMSWWWNKAVVARLKPLLEFLVRRACCERTTIPHANSDPGDELVAASLRRRLSGNLSLAADHLESIRTLLDVSQSHRQAIPRAAFQNLELVSRNLREIERQIAGSQPTQVDSALQSR